MTQSDTTGEFSFLEKEFIARTTVLVLVKAQAEDNQRYYAYVAVPAKKLEALIGVQRSGTTYRLQDYGTILKGGLGEPDEAVRQFMTEHYGFAHDAMIILSDES